MAPADEKPSIFEQLDSHSFPDWCPGVSWKNVCEVHWLGTMGHHMGTLLAKKGKTIENGTDILVGNVGKPRGQLSSTLSHPRHRTILAFIYI